MATGSGTLATGTSFGNRVGGRNLALQGFRGIAAFAVVAHHAAHFTGLKTGATWLEEDIFGSFGYLGVLAFFVLSGFLMEGAVRRYDAKTFLLHRIARLYPTYWALYLCLSVFQAIRLHAWPTEPPWAALSLLPLGEMDRPLHAEWTLIYEVFFYAVCTAVCLWRRAYPLVLAIWLLMIVVAVFRFNAYGAIKQPTLIQIPFSWWNVAFISGSVAGLVGRLDWKPSATGVMLLAGIALMLLSQLFDFGVRLFYSGPGMALIVLALSRCRVVTDDRAGLAMIALFMLGEYSYGIYLAHSLSIQIALLYIVPSGVIGPVSIFFGMLGVGLAVGIAAGQLDVVLYRFLKGAIDKRIRMRARPGVSVPDALGS